MAPSFVRAAVRFGCAWMLSAAVVVSPAAKADFIPGRLYVLGANIRGCAPLGGPALLVEFDPATGQSQVVANYADSIYCGGFGDLTFTPDGSRLLATEFLRSDILSLDSAFAPTPIYDQSDGISGPADLAFDPFGNLYMSMSGSQRILRVPAGGGAPELFASVIDGHGALAASPSGDLFYATLGERTMLRFTPEGQMSTFGDAPSGVFSLVSASNGDLFAYCYTGIFVCRGGQSGQFDLLSPLVTASGLVDLAISSDQSTLFALRWSSQIWTVDVASGVSHLVAELPEFAMQNYLGASMAYYVPEPSLGASAFVLGLIGLRQHRRR